MSQWWQCIRTVNRKSSLSICHNARHKVWSMVPPRHPPNSFVYKADAMVLRGRTFHRGNWHCRF